MLRQLCGPQTAAAMVLFGVTQAITERESGGKKNNRYSYLSHTWRFSVAPGSPVTLFTNAWSGGSSAADTFRIAQELDRNGLHPRNGHRPDKRKSRTRHRIYRPAVYPQRQRHAAGSAIHTG